MLVECFFKQADRPFILLETARTGHLQFRLEPIAHRFVHRLVRHRFAKRLLEPFDNLPVTLEAGWLLELSLQLNQHVTLYGPCPTGSLLLL